MEAAYGGGPYVPPELLAAAAANREKAPRQRAAFLKAVEVAPFILCSTHGNYDLSKEPVEYRVPPDTWVLEAQNIGDLTLTEIDVPLWELLQGGRRWGLTKYLTQEYYAIKQKGTDVYRHYKEVLKTLVLYKPGDKLYKRELSIGGGKGARTDYAGMGFYRFDAGGPAYAYRGYGRKEKGGSRGPYEILHGLQTQMVESADRLTTDGDLIDFVLQKPNPTFLSGEPMNQDFRLALPAGYRGPKIFVFSSCAAISNPRDPDAPRRWATIAALQQQRILESWGMGLNTLGGGGGGTGKMPAILSMRRMETRGETIFAPVDKAIEEFTREDPEQQKLQEKMFKGGSRRKSKNRRKSLRRRKVRKE
jgi:hypothetical protein